MSACKSLYVLVGLALITCCSYLSGQTKDEIKAYQNPFSAILESGNYTVGFRRYLIEDQSRSVGGKKRPIHISFWYPSDEDSQDKSLTLSDYIIFVLEENSTQESVQVGINSGSISRELVLNGIKEELIPELLSLKFTATLSAPIAKGRFPVILIAQGNGHSAYHNLVICENLATQGYLVVSVPAPSRLTGNFRNLREIAALAADQCDDLTKAHIEVSRLFPQNVEGNSGILAYSFGGRSALFLAQGNERYRAIVSWDGAFANEYNKGWHHYAKDFKPQSVKSPLLHIFQPGDHTLKPDFELFGLLGCHPKDTLRITGVNHDFFTSLTALNILMNPENSNNYRSDFRKKYHDLIQATLEFFDRYLK